MGINCKMNEEETEINEQLIWSSTELMKLSLNLSTYRYTLAYSVGSLLFMLLLSGSFLLLQFFSDSTWFIILGWAILVITALGIHLSVFRHILKRVEPMKNESLIMGISYMGVFMFGYPLNGLLGNLIPTSFLWYPLLGCANLIVGITVERFHYKKKELFAQPILLYSIFFFISTPFLLFFILSQSNLPQINFISPLVALILASLVCSYSIHQAEKKVEA